MFGHNTVSYSTHRTLKQKGLIFTNLSPNYHLSLDWAPTKLTFPR